jgi:hypothetical protein
MVPHAFARALYQHRIGDAAWLLWFEIDQLAFNARRNTVKFTNERWRSLGLLRSTKLRALRRLEEAGVIKVAFRGQEAPTVTCLWRYL